jgi:hypothetical protein
LIGEVRGVAAEFNPFDIDGPAASRRIGQAGNIVADLDEIVTASGHIGNVP